jgi:membrane-bound serine protease (ClpP class)
LPAIALLLFLLLTQQHIAGQAAPYQQAAPGDGPVYRIAVQGTLTSAMVGFVRRGVQTAEAANANALIITVSTGGGVLREVRPLAEAIAQARVPVVVFVAPAGTQAGAPGAFLLSAAHVAAMAPGTSFGSAYPLTQLDQALSPQAQAIVSDSLADQLRGWNRARGRSLAWVERAVTAGVILGNAQAIATQPPAVDLVAADADQLLQQLDGRNVTLAGGAEVRLATLSRPIVPIEPSFLEAVWLTLAEPTIAFMLLVLGALAIYLEFAAPGTTLFAGAGVILLIAAAIGLLALPVHAWAVGLVVLALVLLALELVLSAHGGLAIAGLALLAFGALNLVDQVQAPGAGVAPWSIAAMVVGAGALTAAGFVLAMRVRRRPVLTGQEALVGKLAQVRSRLDGSGAPGMVFIDGALWRAVSEAGSAEPGDWVRVVAIHQLQLIVRPLDQDTSSAKE